MIGKYERFAPAAVSLLPGLFKQRFDRNRGYLMSLKSENLLQNHYLEADLGSYRLRNSMFGESGAGDDRHWGWESPSWVARGHFLGH